MPGTQLLLWNWQPLILRRRTPTVLRRHSTLQGHNPKKGKQSLREGHREDSTPGRIPSETHLLDLYCPSLLVSLPRPVSQLGPEPRCAPEPCQGEQSLDAGQAAQGKVCGPESSWRPIDGSPFAGLISGWSRRPVHSVGPGNNGAEHLFIPSVALRPPGRPAPAPSTARLAVPHLCSARLPGDPSEGANALPGFQKTRSVGAEANQGGS